MKSRLSKGFAATFVVVLWAALVDMAIEALIGRANGSAVAVGAAVGATLGLAIAGKRSFGFEAALLLAALLAAVVAASLWISGSLAGQGTMTLARLPADVVAAGMTLTAACILIGLLLLVRRVPSALRIVGALLLAYGALPLAWSLSRSTGLVVALRSNAPLSFVPIYAHGAYLCTQVLFPVCAAVLALGGIVAFVQRRPGPAARALASALVLALVSQIGAYEAGAQGLPTVVGFERNFPATTTPNAFVEATNATKNAGITVPQAAAPGNVARNPMSAENANANTAAAATGGSIAAGGSAASGNLVNVTFPDDVGAAVKTAATAAGSNVRNLFDILAAQIADDIYPGALRGSAGALSAEEANATDKALLLRDLLRSADPNAPLRFAQCTLNDADAQSLVTAILAKPKPRTPIVLESATDVAASTSDALAKATLKRWGLTWQQLASIAKNETATLANALQKLPATQRTAPQDTSAAKQLDAVRTHVWLQRQDNGSWTDLDPTLGAAG